MFGILGFYSLFPIEETEIQIKYFNKIKIDDQYYSEIIQGDFVKVKPCTLENYNNFRICVETFLCKNVNVSFRVLDDSNILLETDIKEKKSILSINFIYENRFSKMHRVLEAQEKYLKLITKKLITEVLLN